MEGFFCLKYLGHQECSFQDFVGFYKELTKSFDVFSGCFSWTCNIFDGESWVVYKAEYKSVRQEIPKNRRGKKRKSFHTHLFLKVFSPVRQIWPYIQTLCSNQSMILMSYLKNACKYLPFRILALFTSTTSSVPPVCSICSCPSIISSQPGGGGAAYHLLALSAVLLLLLLVLLLRLVQLLWSPHLFELSALIHLHGY